MKQFITDLIKEAQYELEEMRKSDMTLKERIRYEKALIRLQMAIRLMNKFNIT